MFASGSVETREVAPAWAELGRLKSTQPERTDRSEEPIDVRRPVHAREAEHRCVHRSARDARVRDRPVDGFGDRVTRNVDAGHLPVRGSGRRGAEESAERIDDDCVGLASAPVDPQDRRHLS